MVLWLLLQVHQAMTCTPSTKRTVLNVVKTKFRMLSSTGMQ